MSVVEFLIKDMQLIHSTVNSDAYKNITGILESN
jgi:hypothetical protein